MERVPDRLLIGLTLGAKLGVLVIGALARMAEVAAHPDVLRLQPELLAASAFAWVSS